MIVPVAVLAVVLAVVAAHRSVDGLANLRLRHWWLLAVALAVQVLIIEVLPDSLPAGVAGGLHMASYAAALAFVAANRAWRGVVVIGVGGALNLAAITANGGVMPARPGAVDAAGLDTGDGFENSAPVTDADLWFLGDVFAVPRPLPLANVFSVGDVVIVVGAGLLVHEASRDAGRDGRDAPGQRTPAVGR